MNDPRYMYYLARGIQMIDTDRLLDELMGCDNTLLENIEAFVESVFTEDVHMRNDTIERRDYLDKILGHLLSVVNADSKLLDIVQRIEDRLEKTTGSISLSPIIRHVRRIFISEVKSVIEDGYFINLL